MKARTEKTTRTPGAKRPRRAKSAPVGAPAAGLPASDDLRHILDALSQGICVHRDHIPLYVNRAFARVHGYDEPTDVLALGSVLNLMPADQHALSKERVARRLAGLEAPRRFQETQIRKDGSRILVEKSISVVEWDGSPALMIAMGEVTEAAEIASALGKSERRFADFAEVASDWFWETDRDHRFSYLSPRFQEVSGVDPESRRGKRRTDIAIPTAATVNWARHLADLEAHLPFRNLVYAYPDGHGGVRHVRVSGKPMFADNGEFVGYRGTGTDITAEVQALEQAARNHRRLEEAVAAVPAAFYVFDKDERLEMVNGRVHHLYPSNQPVRKPGSTYEQVTRWSLEHDEIQTHGQDRESWLAARLVQFRDPPESFELQLGDGRWIKGLDRKTADGGTVSIRFDITDEKRTVEALRLSQEAQDSQRRLLQAVLDALPLWVFVKDRESRYVLVNGKMAEDQGFPQADYAGVSSIDAPVKDADTRRAFYEADMEVLRTGRVVDVPEERVPLPAGYVSLRHTIKVPLRDAEGSISGVVGISEEINSRKQAEAEIRESEERYRNLVNSSLQGMAIIANGRFEFVNPAEARIFGFKSPEDMVGRKVLDHMPKSTHARILERWGRLEQGEVLDEWEHEIIGGDGSIRWVRGIARPMEHRGNPAFLAIHFDITATKLAELGLHRSEERFRNLIEGSIQGMLIHRRNLPLFANAAYARMFGYASVDALMAEPSLDHLIAPEDRPRVSSYYAARLRGEIVPDRYTFKGVRQDGSPLWVETLVRVIDWEGAPAAQGTYVDITEQQEALRRLQASEERFRNLVEGSIQGVIVHRNLSPLFVNEAFARIFGYASAAELLAMPSMKVVVAPGDQERLFSYQKLRLEGGDAPAYYQFEGVKKDGTRVWLDAISRVVHWDGALAVQTALFDISRRKVLEAELRQSQKMEAIGKLAGGIAHDFNNLLQVISGFNRLALDDVPETEPLHRDLEMVQGAVDRATDLTRQLLAFSRRQVLNPVELSLRDLAANLVKLIERLIERHISVSVVDAGNTPYVRADAGMIEQVLMNLCVNARDAMPTGGELTIETSGVELDEEGCRGLAWAKPGYYGMVSVADTGLGIPPEARDHIFDPFFTTKEIGKGTGLGLSTVFGIVQQHQGFLAVDSAPGHGSIFRVYLPAVDGESADTPDADRVVVAGGNETILIVEDEAAVQHFATRTLSRGGYRVMSAENGSEALVVLQQKTGDIQLVLLDLIMPGMTGAEVYEHIRRAHPSVRVIVATGYSTQVPQGGAHDSVVILHKPYSPEQLLASVRKALESP